MTTVLPDPDMVVLVPTRSRPHNVLPLIEAFVETCTANTLLCFCIDGCPQHPEYVKAISAAVQRLLPEPGGDGLRVTYVSGPRRRLVGTLNHYATLLAPDTSSWRPPAAVAYMGDDHRPQTRGWDSRYIEALQALGTGIVYGDDRLQGPTLPTQVAMTSDIVGALGYMAPPVLTHMYCDNYWYDLGTGAQSLRYLPDVVIEHRHPATGATAWDDSYRDSNSAARYAEDCEAYEAFCQDGALARDIETVKTLKGSRP